MRECCLNWLRSSLVVAVLVFLGGTRIAAQIDRVPLTGTITDASGAVVPNAKIEALAQDTGLRQETKSNSSGVFRINGLAVGLYTVTVSHSGFQSVQYKDVRLEVGITRTLDVQLNVASVAERIEVMANPAPLERTSADNSSVIHDTQIGDLPLNGRNWATLFLLAPFAQDDGGGDQRTIRFAGRARDDNNYTFDGVESTGIQEQAQKSTIRLQISADAIAEYNVKSALYSAEYGAGDGGQINVVTKSGTNELHGTVFGYIRNSAFDARAFIDPSPAPPFRLGQYGGTFGGPIIKDRTFFFLSYEGLRQFQGRTLIAPVPDPAAQQQTLTTSPVMCPILQAFPWRASTGTINGCAPRFTFPDSFFSEQTGGVDNFTHQGATTIHEDTVLLRIDHKFTDGTSLYARGQRDIALSSAPLGNALDRQGITNHPGNYAIALQHVFTPSIVNEFKFGVNRSPFHNPQFSVFPIDVITPNWGELFNTNTDNEVGTTFSYIDNLTMTHGRHTFKTGIEIRRIRLNQGVTADNGITYAATSPPADPNFLFFENHVDNLLYRSSWSGHALRRTLYLPYFQDEWKLTRTFTANLGIRWEYYGVANEVHNRTTVFDLQTFHGVCVGSGSINPLKATESPNCPKNPPLYSPNYRNWDPRIGFAWAPSKLHGNTVVRTGLGIYHGAAQNDDLNSALESDNIRQTLTSNTGTTPQLAFGPGYLQDPPNFGTAGQAQPTPRALQRDKRDLYVEEWGLTVDQALPGNFVFSTSYLGSHGVRLFARSFVNTCLGRTNFSPTGCQRPLDTFPAAPGVPFGLVDIKFDDGTSTYHGLQLSLQRRMTNGWSFQTNYTFSHSINDGSVGGGQANASENVACRACDRGPSIFDTRHNFVFNTIYQLPIGPGRAHWQASGFAGKLLEGWNLSGMGMWHTGHPLTVIFSPSASNLPDGNDQSDQRPDLVPGVSLTPPGGATSALWINPAAFQSPPTDINGNLLRWGNAGRGLVRAPSVWQVDFALAKNTKLTERLAMEFRVEAFNIFNHTQLGDPSALDFQSSTFGQINTTVNFNNNNDSFAPDNVGSGLPRQLEFVVRFKF
ncbi:MAG: carboxypeptidase regulatory-like domain-containing protein [Candidatus Acidiferrales bacterium]